MRRYVILLLAGAGLVVAGCGDTVQSAPLGRSALESLLLAKFPVYWAGNEVEGLQAREISVDPGGAVTLQYGNCLEGGQGTCVAPLRIVTSPNNDFVPGGAGPVRDIPLRGTTARTLNGGSTIVVPAGPVVLSVFATSDTLADAAAARAAPITDVAAFGQPLPPPGPSNGHAGTALPGQIPPYQPIPKRRPRRAHRRARR